MNRPSSLRDHRARLALRDLLNVEWVAILLATVVVCVTALTLDAIV